MTLVERGPTAAQRQLKAHADLEYARVRQLRADAAMPPEQPGGRPAMLSEEQLLAEDAVEDAEHELCRATLACIESNIARRLAAAD